MKANSCNMQELWPGNKNYCTCASCVVLPGRAAGDRSLVRPSAPSGTQPLHVVLLRQKNIVISRCEMNAARKGNVPPVDQPSMMSQRGQGVVAAASSDRRRRRWLVFLFTITEMRTIHFLLVSFWLRWAEAVCSAAL